jgi:predicted ATPase/DNA-binding SARP family transcriptional activator
MQRVTIAMLGEPYIAVDDVPALCPSKKALGLFYYLALSGHRTSRRELARLFWGGSADAARTSLRTALQRLPASLSPWLAVDRESIELRSDFGKVELDTARFMALAKADDVASLTDASQLYRGDLLKGLDLDAAPEFDDWLHRERALFRQIAQSVFDRLIARHRERAQRDVAAASSEREAAMAAARRWTTLEPAAESAHRWLMRLFFEAGQRDAALAQFEVCQRELAVALGRGPDAETRALYEAIAAGRFAASTPADSAAQGASPQPVRAPELAGTTFVGRVDELAALDQLIGDPACRLLTLHALGGTGKSRLAFALANQVAARYEMGATWVALDEVLATEHLPAAIARAAGIEFGVRAEPTAALCTALRDQERLLILDNFEHLIAGGGVDMVLAILRGAPRVTLLVTSRETLGIQEEWIFEVPGLGFPAPEATPSSAPGEFPAIELFVQRARQAYLGFSPRAEWPHVVRICRLVEGLPLAIELAAAWVRTLPCGDLAQAIESEMAAVATRHRNRPPRQQSLDAVVRTSWALLTREQQHALAALSVFVGGFTQEGAQAVAEASLRSLSALVDKSLVVRRADGRLRLHELVRQFAQAQLVSRATAARLVRRRYATFYAALLERCRASLDGPQDLEAEATLSAELANLTHAQALWLEGQALDGTAEALLRVMMGRGLNRQGLAFANQVLQSGATLSPASRAAVLTWRGHAQMVLGEMDATRQDLEAAIALARRHELAQPLAFALATSVIAAFYNDDFDRVADILRELEPLAAGIDDDYVKLRTRLYTGLLLDGRGHSAQAESAIRETLQMGRKLGSPVFVATVQTNLAIPLLKQGRLEEAEALLTEAFPVLERSGRQPFFARVLMALSFAVLWRSRRAEAQVAAGYAARALTIYERADSPYGVAVAADTLGAALFALGRFDEARAQFERAAQSGIPTVEADAKFHLAWLCLQRGDPATAARLGLELVELARSLGLGAVQRSAVLIAAALAIGEPSTSQQAIRWLRITLGDPDFEFEPRLYAMEMLEAHGASVERLVEEPAADLLAEIGAFLAPRR